MVLLGPGWGLGSGPNSGVFCMFGQRLDQGVWGGGRTAVLWLMLSLSCPQPTPIGTMHSEVQVQPPNRDKAQPHTKHQVSGGTAPAGARDHGHALLGFLFHSPTEPSRASGWRQGLGHPFFPSAVCGRASSLQVWVCG